MHTETNGNIDHTWSEISKDTPQEATARNDGKGNYEGGENSEIDVTTFDKITTNIINSSINKPQKEDEDEKNEIQVQNSQKYPFENSIPENQSSPHIRTPRLDKLRNFFKENRSPTKRNSPTKIKEKEKKIEPPLSNDPLTFKILENEISENNLDTQNIKTGTIKQVIQSEVTDKSDMGIILEGFDNSPPDTPESQRVLPDSNLKEIKELIGTNDNDLETKPVSSIDTQFLTSNINENADLTTQPINPVETVESLNRVSSINSNGETFTKISMHRNQYMNFKITQDNQEVNPDMRSLGSTANSNLNIMFDDVTNDDANISNHWQFKKDSNGEDLETYNKTTQLIDAQTQKVPDPNNTTTADTNANPQPGPTTSTQADITPLSKETALGSTNLVSEKQTTSTISNSSVDLANKTTDLNSDGSKIDAFMNVVTSHDIIDLPQKDEDNSDIINRSNLKQIPELSENSSPTKLDQEINGVEPLEKSLSSIGSPKLVSDSKEKRYLKVSCERDSSPLIEKQIKSQSLDSERNNVIMSDVEITQELPEVPELSDHDIDDSQSIVIGRKKTKRYIPSLQLSEENEFSQDQSVNGQYTKREYPIAKRDFDDRPLTREDIIFENAVWCQYVNFHYYPGVIQNRDSFTNKYDIIFDRDRYSADQEQLYYLDVIIGDIVRYKTHRYAIVALECQKPDPSIIRCIRGYDTVYLKKKDGPSHPNEPIIIPMSWIQLDLDDWTTRKRMPLKVTNKSDQSTDSPKFTKTKKRVSRVGTKGSPRKRKRVNYKEDSDDEIKVADENFENSDFSAASNCTTDEEGIETMITEEECPLVKRVGSTISQIMTKSSNTDDIENTIAINVAQKVQNNPNAIITSSTSDVSKIFDGCVFAFTGFREVGYELKDTIIRYGGDVIDLGFSDLFSFSTQKKRSNIQEFNLGMRWKNGTAFRNYRFACVIADRYLRSSKYLETLALKWPTLQRKFIDECIFANKVDDSIIRRYLLPSGESSRLDDLPISSFIKSNNIFQFLTNYLKGETLDQQTGLSSKLMGEFAVIICKDSNLTDFAKFVFACFGVKRLFQIPNVGYLKSTNENFNEVQSILRGIKDEELKTLFYLNNGQDQIQTSKSIQDIQHDIETGLANVGEYYVKDREWLIQTIINEDTGLS
ncbi:similar to Saccharomyces cerevisiae YDR217C RAD9 DNA damage-dependent checkpoint protein, required for cell-cycle arrest in G1/S, intra-S, and G2/M [Maudiozyma saulgeensis]|uniref:Similar to Saccharomyces cerevisiae YDR217C RAD9 DNA damage-dependent checkpoint protein, required for cell-cycle arrest in G1/S, intra-S, and G2/M n=1 Tax=Maudiozyma saulgeensis TaxID=1789683 RepID=A0A1X7R5F7_9SACH|nr:similar to Saccharomyces cerevisiae YDR217C RAD9 DNA damage-dependent checkpoint protein, required for cell-cycle arrest in G1/S, intra-S, and G2/M [Kazachstania saulgeensis]